MKRNRTCACIALALCALLLLAGCGGGGGMGNSAAPSSPAASTPAASAPMTSTNSDFDAAEGELGWVQNQKEDQGSGGGEDSPVYRDAGAKLIRRAELSIQTEKFDETHRALEALVVQYSGYFEMSSVYGGSYRDANARKSGEYTVRVPAEHYNSFKTAAGDLGYVTNSTESSEDVGERYYDAEARLKTQRTKQERLLAMLEKADTMEAIIALQDALSEVEYQIEQYSSELKRYDSLIGYSTFHIWLEEVRSVQEEVGEAAPFGARLAAGVSASARALARSFENFLLWCSYNLFGILIFAVVLGVIAVVGTRQLRKQWKKRGEKKELPEREEDKKQ